MEAIGKRENKKKDKNENNNAITAYSLESLKQEIKAIALENALKFGGKASNGAVIGKIIVSYPELKKDIKNLSKAVSEAVEEISKKSLDEQKKELDEIKGKLGNSIYKRKSQKQKSKKAEESKKSLFSFIKISCSEENNGKDKKSREIITAFPPGPEKYPHIGHAKAILLNYLLAKEYNGKFILRFEDTNPELVKKEFYEIMQENFRWLGIEWDELIYASDYMELFYKHCRSLIEKGKAYVCFCPKEKIKEGRLKGIACKCRKKSPEENLKAWKNMPCLKPGEAIVRLKISLKHKNSTMRDPAIFRIIDKEHARHKSKYRLWPNYDFQNAIMDGYSGITHRLRSKEFEMRNELHGYIQELLGYKKTKIYEFGRLNLSGVLSSGRVIREKIEKGELIGWDDPSLTTIVALRRRGFLPEAIKSFVLSTGITKADATLTWDDLIVQNRRIVDKKAMRYFFINEPIEITIENAPTLELKLRKHPTAELGFRKLKTGKSFFIEKKDYEKIKAMKIGSLIRLMDCLNFRKDDDKFVFESLSYDEFKKESCDKLIIHFLPKDEENIAVKIVMPDKELKKGLAESSAAEIKENDIVQFERFGFCRLDSRKEMIFWFTHS